MLVEKLPGRIAIKRLQKQLETEILQLPSAQRGNYGGWSVLSSTGDTLDGWHSGSDYFKDKKLEKRYREPGAFLKSIGAKDGRNYIKPTPICSGYLEVVVQKLIKMGLCPHRTQIARLKANSSIPWHRDSKEDQYCVRIHIPIQTNTGCFLEYENSRHFLPADGSIYLIDASSKHRVVNEGDTDRYHLVSYGYDLLGASKSLKYKSNLYLP